MNFVKKHIFRIVSGDSPKTRRKLNLSTKFPLQEVRWNYGIFRSVGLWALHTATRSRLSSITGASVKICKIGYRRVTYLELELLPATNKRGKQAENPAKCLVQNPKNSHVRESFSFKSLKNYYSNSIFDFKLTYFVVSEKETAVDISILCFLQHIT